MAFDLELESLKPVEGVFIDGIQIATVNDEDWEKIKKQKNKDRPGFCRIKITNEDNESYYIIPAKNQLL